MHMNELVVSCLQALFDSAYCMNGSYKMPNGCPNIPSYAITIPFSSQGKSPFEAAEVDIPVGMTVIWFNDDSGGAQCCYIAK
jgi:hypothetical protein